MRELFCRKLFRDLRIQNSSSSSNPFQFFIQSIPVLHSIHSSPSSNPFQSFIQSISVLHKSIPVLHSIHFSPSLIQSISMTVSSVNLIKSLSMFVIPFLSQSIHTQSMVYKCYSILHIFKTFIKFIFMFSNLIPSLKSFFSKRKMLHFYQIMLSYSSHNFVFKFYIF